jgi:hypothetical protein
MGWEAVAVGALGFAQYQQQGAVGKYNQQIQNRNAEVARQQGEQIEKQAEFDIAQFDKDFTKKHATAKTNILKSGAELSGSGLRILRANAEEAELQRQTIRYNAEVGKANSIERANFYTMQGNLARQQAKLAQIQTLTKTGTTLLGMSGGKKPSTQDLNFEYTGGVTGGSFGE